MDWAFWIIAAIFFVYVGADRLLERSRKKNYFLCADLGYSFGKRGVHRGNLYHELARIFGENEEARKQFERSHELEKVQSHSDMVH